MNHSDSEFTLTQIGIDRFWHLIKEVLAMLYDESPARADDLRQAIEVLPSDAQILFYHNEPIHIASAIVGQPVTRSRTEDYVVMRYVRPINELIATLGSDDWETAAVRLIEIYDQAIPLLASVAEKSNWLIRRRIVHVLRAALEKAEEERRDVTKRHITELLLKFNPPRNQ